MLDISIPEIPLMGAWPDLEGMADMVVFQQGGKLSVGIQEAVGLFWLVCSGCGFYSLYWYAYRDIIITDCADAQTGHQFFSENW